MRIAAISDTHGRQDWTMPACDVFIHAGDMTGRGLLGETAVFARKLREGMAQPGGPSHAILVPGNHDACFELQRAPTLALFPPEVHVLVDRPLVLDGVRFFGSPWTPPFMQWHFMASEGRLAALYALMPAELDVLVTHGPPRGVLDPGWKTGRAGSTALAEALGQRTVRHHVFGHLHAAGGRMMERNGNAFYNVAACDEGYQLVKSGAAFRR